jgi:hypothetical protein
MKHWRTQIFFSAFLVITMASFAQAQATYSGNILDAIDKRYIEGVEVSVLDKSGASFTNLRGYFSIKASEGDTLMIRLPGFYDQKIKLGKDRFLLVQLQDRANLLPSFEVKSDPYSFRFKDGKLTLVDPDESMTQIDDKQVSLTKGTSTGAGTTINGPISYFSRKARNEREYARKLEIISRRQGYLGVVDSDSVRTKLMESHQLDRETWDKLILRFNQINLSHQFMDWSSEQVLGRLNEFLFIEKALMN